MSNYTPEEVQAAVSKIVLSTVSHPTGVLGNRNISSTFNDLQEAAAGVYVLYFNAPFYTIKLGTTRLADLVDSQAQTITQLIDAVQATSKLVTPVSDISALANASSALQALGTAVSNRSQGFSDVTEVPAYRAYASNINQFVQQVGGNIKGVSADPSQPAGTIGITDTPQGARAQIPGLITQLQNQHQELIRRATLLAGAMKDFGSMNLPQVAAQGVISRAGDVLKSHYNDLASQDENTRLNNLRAVVLDLLTQQPIVQKFGGAIPVNEFITTKGFATAYSDSTHPSTPATLLSDLPGPYGIVPGNNLLSFAMDGGAPFDYPMPLAHIAELTGQLQEPFSITPTNNKLRIVFDNPDVTFPVTFNVTLTLGPAQTADQVILDIAPVIAGTDLIVERIFSPLKFDSIMTVISLGGNNARFNVVAGELTGLGIAIGDVVDIESGPDAGTSWTIYNVPPVGLFVDATGPSPVTPVVFPADIEVKIGPAARALNLFDNNPVASLSMRRVIRLPLTHDVPDSGAATLGWFPGSESRTRPVAAKDLAANITVSVPTASATAIFAPLAYTGQAHAELTDASKVVLSILQAEGTITGGLDVTFTPNDAALDLSVVTVHDRLVLRSTLAGAEVNQEGDITSVVPGALVIHFASPITAGAVGIEVGPDVVFGFGDVLNITDGNNQARYVVREDQGIGTTCSFELLLESGLPVPKNGAVPATFGVTFGRDYIQFNSLLTRTTSSVRLNNGSIGTGALYFFLHVLPVSSTGTTPYLRFATFPAGVEVGDLVLLYEDVTNFTQPTRDFIVTGVDQAFSTIKVTPELEAAANFNFSFNVPVPFGRIRVAQVADFSSLSTGLTTWVNSPQQQTQFFRNLARVLNPVLLNARPTVAEVNTAANQLKILLADLTASGANFYGSIASPPIAATQTLGAALSSYSAPVESAVDALLASFRDKSADRAIDLLLEGQFAEFFGLDVASTSYSGALMKNASALAMNDLPIRKSNRTNLAGQTTIGTIPNQTDFEYNSDDADSPNTPDLPVGADTPSPGANF